ncbi:MAG: hypothetical protein HS115_15815 [Spirochaetales bacterium]|nr:hypothetical protein [Spirochaetales bacterium]
MKILRTAILLFGFIHALLSILEGSRVLIAGPAGDQIVLPWLVTYNVAMALFSLPVLYLVFRQRSRGQMLSLSVLAAHTMVFLVLLGIYLTTGQVAGKSVIAMAVRSAVWALIFWQSRIAKR